MLNALWLTAALAPVLIAPVGAQEPLTADSLAGAVREIARIAQHLRHNDSISRRAQADARQLMSDFRDHNSQPCSYPSGQAELCANYDAERMELNLRSAALQRSLKAIENDRVALQHEFDSLATHLAAATFAPSARRYQASFIACVTQRTAALAERCLVEVFPRSPEPEE